jgi:hypothetical protein
VFRIWEHDIERNSAHTATRITRALTTNERRTA